MGRFRDGMRAVGSYFGMPTVPPFVFDLDATPAKTFMSDQPISQAVARGFDSGYGTRVGRAEALSVPAVQRGRNLICGIATLPLIQRGPDRTVVRNSLLDQLDLDVANVVTLSQTLEDLLFEGISWWRILSQDFHGFPVAVQHVDVTSVSLQPPGGRNPAPLPSGEDPRNALVWVDGHPVSASQMIRFDSPNPGLLRVGGRAIKRAILLDQAAKMYANEPRAIGYFAPADGATDPASDEDIAEMLADFADSRQTRAVGYVPGAMRYNPIDQMSPADLQLVNLQQQATLDIANAMGIDPEELGVNITSRVYQNAVDRRQDRINDTLAPYMRAITDRLSMGDVTRRGYTVAFDLDDYLKANPADRWAVYEKAIQLGVMSREEIREKEGLPAGAPPIQAAPRPQAAIEASRPDSMSFASESENFFDVDVQGFAADKETRTISGVALPYGKVAIRGGRKYRFDHGSLTWSDLARVKLLRDHNYSLPLGRAVELEDTPEGFRVKFKVGRGDDGDRALALAEDGVLDGLSVGVDFQPEDTTPDPLNRGVTLVRRALLREVSLTAMPAFDDARVATVAASLTTEGNTVTDTPIEPQAPVPAGGPVAETFDAATVGRLLAAMSSNPTPLQAALSNDNDVRQTVNPTRLTAHVNDPAPYRFDAKGNIQRGSHDFSQDLFAATKGDVAAKDRAETFVREQFDVATTDVNELNPTRNRPNLYVDQRDFRYPVWDAINKGSLADITPFTFPKFSSASGLVGAHTEGSEPTSGTFVTTSQTVTPTAISGKAKITRETWDQGGNPQVSNLIWRQMVKGWYEALEAAAVAVLDAASPTAIALTAGGGTTGQTLSAELIQAFASLQFVRGGFSMTDMFTQIDLYKALAGARDGDGRPLFPAIGPANANGTSRQRWGAIDVNGVVALPSWALAATGSVVASSYLFDRDSVHGWATAPQRLDFNIEVAHVYIGLWGYKATAISDINGVREITYDPVA